MRQRFLSYNVQMEAGKSLVSVGVGGYRNENALAVGYGRNSDNNKISIKVGKVSIPAVM